ncbi:MAG: photosynthetic reaction center cytochrome c subunit [Acidobacteria bacterium]|nr:photosynthetic reaction center cytochrome c subunit [Acidobacteriota bacterium]
MRGVRRVVLVGAAAVLIGVAGVVVAGAAAQGAPPAAAGQAPPMAETVFKNVQVLKGIPVDEFMDTMGMFAAATTKDCTGCHAPEVLTASRDAFAKETPMIQRARQMVVMMNTINRTYFRGERRVTCYTCHSATSNPQRVPNLSIQYGTPPGDNPDTMDFVAIPEDANRVDQIFGKYVQAIGGAQRWAAAASFAASGTYAGWDTSRSEVPVDFFGKAPNQLTTVVHRREGNNTWVFDGGNFWYAGVDAAVPNFTMTYTGGNLAGARIDAMVMNNPTLLQKAFSRWQVSENVIDDKPVLVLQGTNQGQPPVNLFFDESGLLVRLIRWSDTAVGPVPTQFDFSDYREVGGVRRPFHWVKAWTNNQVVFVLKDVRTNAPIEASRFARPAPIALK